MKEKRKRRTAETPGWRRVARSAHRAAWILCASLVVWAFAARTARAELPSDRPRMVTAETERAINKALKYLSSKQNSDGSWRNEGSYGSYPVTMTALSGLALTSSGSTPTQGPYAPHLRKAVNYLVHS